jgi:hypothetical protein
MSVNPIKEIYYFTPCPELNNMPRWRYLSSEIREVVRNYRAAGKSIFTLEKVEFLASEIKADKVFTLEKDVQFKKGDNLYFVPNLAFPRYKVREKGEEIGFKIKRSIDDSDYVVIDPKTINNNLQKISNRAHVGLATLTKFNFDQIAEELKIPIDYNNFESEIDNNTLLYFPNGYAKSVDFIFTTLNNDSFYEYKANSYETGIDLRDVGGNNKELANSMYNILTHAYKKTKKFISSNTLLETINPKVIINDSMYTRLKQMFESNNKDNIMLAMETMANVDIKKSLFNIIKLCTDYGHLMRWSDGYNHVNFKAFRTSLNDMVGLGRDAIFTSRLHFTDTIDILGKNQVLTKAHLDSFKAEMERHLIDYRLGKFFKVEKISATELLSEYLKNSKEYLNEEEQIEETEEVDEHAE